MFKKRCGKCGVLKDVCEFSKNRTTKDGLQPTCKACRQIEDKKWREEHKAQAEECTRKWHETHKAQTKEYSRKYREAHRLQKRENDKIYRESHKAQLRGYRLAHQEETRNRGKEYREKNKEKIRKYQREYCRTVKGRAIFKRHNHARHAKKNNCVADMTEEQWQRIIKNQGNRCNACGRKFTAKNPPTQDHIIPLSLKGDYSSDNIQALCKPCNSSKRARVDTKYIQTWNTHKPNN